MVQTLTTTRYTAPGVYIGQLIQPGAGSLSADARVCDYIGQGSKLAVGSNLGIRRSFVYGEDLIVTTAVPYQANLSHAADGTQDPPVRLYDTITGVELRPDQWSFIKIAGQFTQIQIAPSAYNSLAVYALDYQSTDRSVLDPLPIAGLVTIKTLGTVQGKAEFEDLVDFYIPYSFTGPTPTSTNSTTSSFLTSIFPDAGNTGSGTTAIDPSASYVHNYNRFYQLTVIGVGGIAGAYTATFEWSAVRYSGGIGALPPTPLDSSATKPFFTAQESIPVTLVQDLELGVKVAVAFDGINNFALGDKFYFNGVGPGLIEWDGRYTNTNQYLTFDPIEALVSTGTGTLSYGTQNTYIGVQNTHFRLEVTNSAGAFGSRTVTFVWAEYGEVIGATSIVLVSEAVNNSFTLTQGVELTVDWGSSNFNIGDTFDFTVKAPQIFYENKDDRVYTLTVSTATNPGADTGVVTGAYSTGTATGGFGSWQANVNLLFGVSQETGYFVLPDNIRFAVRNAMRGNINGTSYAAGDVYTAAVTSENVINWSLTTKVEETRDTSAFVTDVIGAVTGTAGTTYVILDNAYVAGTVSVVDADTLIPISFIEIPNTRFVAFVTTPTNTVLINYEYIGAEPSPGQLYYLTAYYLRPTNLYNNPTLILDLNDGRLFLGPAETENHLYIMNELVFAQGAPAAYYTQPYDADGDGILTRTDVLLALEAHATASRATDLCVLSQFESLSDALAVNEQANDPFERREQMLWIGAPIGTPIGDINTPDSLVFLARNTLQVPPQSVAMGTRVLLAPTTASVTITLDNGIAQSVTLDGSFVAGATSALVNSFTDPATSILRRNLSGFDHIQTYSEPENLILGNASITWMSDQGNSVYRFEEDITVHTLSEIYQLIAITVQTQYVTRVVRSTLDSNVIGIVVPSAQAGISVIRAQLAQILLGLLGRSLIAQYQDENGNVREFDTNKDIIVLRDTSSLTKYNVWFSFFVRSNIKRIFGLYAVDTNNFGF